MRTFLIKSMLFTTLLLTAASAWAQPQGLERVGPPSAAHGFPTWYQDKTGLALEFCQPQNQAELDAGWCLLLPGDTTVPEAFPGTFADEHFYWAGDAAIATPTGMRAQLVLGLEAAFGQGAVLAGDQVVFARIRIRVDPLPATGTYTIYHPFGTEVLEGVAGERLFWTEDIGIACADGAFECALNGRIGPFLLPSNEPGGAELPAVSGPVPRKLYIADPARLGPVTGSPVGQNYFRVVGPGGLDVATSNFSLMGRLFQGTMPGRVTVERASYARTAETGKIDVFATAVPTAPARLPGTGPAPVVLPLLDFFPSPCAASAAGLGAPAGVTPVPMVGEGSRFYGQIQNGPIPAAVCVRDSTARDVNGQVVPIFRELAVNDEVRITAAEFDPANGGRLRVVAASSDAFAQPALSALIIGELQGSPVGEGEAAVIAPPVRTFVTSARGGHASREVTTLAGALSPGLRPLAGNDTASMNEDDPNALIVHVLANDVISGRAITESDNPEVTVTGTPRLGTASVNSNGTIAYVPALNATGSDLLTYTVTVGSQTSPPAFVSVTILNVNDPPLAVDDAIAGVAGLGVTVPLLDNDSDPDGRADLRDAVVIEAPAGVAYSVAAGVLTFSAGAGTHVFQYQARDAAGALSNVATATVTLAGQAETLSITRAEYIANKRRWRVEGTSSIAAGQAVYVMYANGTFGDLSPAAGYLIGTAQVGAGGLWAVDFALAGTNDPRNPTSTALFSTRPTQVYAISTVGGASPGVTFRVR